MAAINNTMNDEELLLEYSNMIVEMHETRNASMDVFASKLSRTTLLEQEILKRMDGGDKHGDNRHI